jgi:hypothetical protein
LDITIAGFHFQPHFYPQSILFLENQKQESKTMAPTLFEVPIGASGKVTVTEPAAKVYLLTFASPPDNRLTTVSSDSLPALWIPTQETISDDNLKIFCKALHLALDIIQTKYPPGVVITTSALPKFYSNGLDLEHATSTPGFFTQTLYGLWHRLLTYPMPTIALLNGHTFAGGLMVAMMHDYRIMNPHKGFLCLNELVLGVGLRPPMCSVFREKVGAATFRRMILEAVRFKVSCFACPEVCMRFLGRMRPQP